VTVTQLQGIASQGIDKVQLKVKGIASLSGLITLEADRHSTISVIARSLPGKIPAMLLELVGLTVQGVVSSEGYRRWETAGNTAPHRQGGILKPPQCPYRKFPELDLPTSDNATALRYHSNLAIAIRQNVGFVYVAAQPHDEGYQKQLSLTVAYNQPHFNRKISRVVP